MARFEVFQNPVALERSHTPFFLDVQNDHLDALSSRVVVPLRKQAAFGPRARSLNPLLQVLGEDLVLDTAALGAVATAVLRRPATQLGAGRNEVLDALDTLFGAY